MKCMHDSKAQGKIGRHAQFHWKYHSTWISDSPPISVQVASTKEPVEYTLCSVPIGIQCNAYQWGFSLSESLSDPSGTDLSLVFSPSPSSPSPPPSRTGKQFLSDPSPIIGNACHSLPNWLTNSCLVIDWCDPGVWRCLLKTCKTCWGC